MKKLSYIFFILFWNLTSFAQLSVSGLKTEGRENPVGLDIKQPRFSWVMESGKRNVKQIAYEISVSEDKKKIWATGKTVSETSVHIPYNGPALQSGRHYKWQVKVWDNQNSKPALSGMASFQTALFNPESEITARWITSCLKADSTFGIVPLFRTTFSTGKKIKSATAYITAKGLYEAEINGKRVGDAFLTPGWTAYKKRLLYQTYDVTGLLNTGQNTVGIALASGWFRGELGWEKKTNTYGNQTALLFQLEIIYTDGSKEIVISDDQWKVSPGPMLSSEIYDGEIYDARLEQKGWTSTTFDDNKWSKARVVDFPKNILSASTNELIKKHETFKPVKVLTTPKGETVLDFGQNMVGWIQMNVSGKAGSKIIFSHVEILDKKGNLYFDNLRNAQAQDTYILKGEATEVYEPHFTFHGFRYVRVEGLAGTINPENFTAIALYSDMQPTGKFECSNAMVNQLQKNIQWGQRGNFLDVPTDCPQRDERLGWTGDAEVFSRTAAYNFNVNNFFTKWLKDLAAEQYDNGAIPFVIPDILKGTFFGRPEGAAGWSDAGIIIPWNMYVAYGDKRIVEEQYSSMKAYLDYMRKSSKNDLWNTGFQFGDWLSYRVDDSHGMIGQKSAVTDNYLVTQCFYAYSVDIMIKSAKLLGRTDEVKEYESLLERIKKAFQLEYVTPGGRLISETQTAYVLALYMDMLPEPVRPQAVERLVNNIKSYDYHLTTGFLGTPFLNSALTRFGQSETAYKLLLQDTYPSWLFPVKMGATTIWERWDSQKPDSTFQDPSMTSFNHYAYGAVGDWMYRSIAGIDTREEGAGYKEIIIKPIPGGNLTSASGSIETYYGKVSSAWKKDGDKLSLDIEIPVNTSATIYIPVKDKTNKISENGTLISSASDIQTLDEEDGFKVFKVGSGNYHFSVLE